MPQMQLPVFYDGVNAITNDVGYENKEGTVLYYCGTMPVFSHAVEDLDSFRMIVSQLYVNGTVRQADLVRAFQIKPLALKRWVKRYRTAGARAFFQSRKGGSKPRVLTAEVRERVQVRLDRGERLSEIAGELGLKYDVLRKAVGDGRLKKPLKKKEDDRPLEPGPAPPLSQREAPAAPATKSQRSAEDAQAPMGVATTNVLDRVLASVGLLAGVPVRFERCEDVSCGGVLLALPALLACGLLRYSAKYFSLPKGYYTLANIFLLLGLMTLNRVKSIEGLRRCAPGEWGKILGLDRCPVAETLRKKIQLITHSKEAVEQWAGALAQDWIQAESLEGVAGGLLYLVDGHVRVYHGSQTRLPRHYVARQRLCCRATTDYWVNQPEGTPLFKINQAVDPGMIEVLREQIVPRLEADIPNQPTERQLEADPCLCRFTLVFDREGYSPGFFRQMWQRRIACQTYRKQPYELWAQEEFFPTQVQLSNGQRVTWKLAERGVLLGSKPEERIWVREVRKRTDRGHQTSVVGTHYGADAARIARDQFGRWSQENFFHYAGQSFDLDRLIDYQLESVPDTVEVVNPRWRELDAQVRRERAVLARHKGQFAGLVLKEPIETQPVQEFLGRKQALQEQIQQQEARLEELKKKRREQERKIPVSQLPEAERFEQLSNRSKHFIDTIKIVAYRAETALVHTLREKIHAHHQDEARSLARQIFQTEANLIPDPQAKTLTVEIHGMSTPRDDAALEHLCAELTATETQYPGTDLRLIYRKVSS